MTDDQVRRLMDVVNRMNEAIARLSESFIFLDAKLNEFEAKLEDLRTEFNHHAHPHPPTDHPLNVKPGHQTNP